MELISKAVENGIAHLRLNRPRVRNAISRSMWLEIPTILTDFQQQGARVVIISGSGGIFSAGADLTELESIAEPADAENNWLPIYEALTSLANCPLPTIGAIDGACLGGGCLLACACDMRYATGRSSFAVPIAQLGIILDEDNISRLACLIGPAKTKEMIFGARNFDSAEALSMGLLNGLVDGDVIEHVLKIAQRIATMSPQSISATKSALSKLAPGAPWGTGSQETSIKSYLSPDFRGRISGRSSAQE